MSAPVNRQLMGMLLAHSAWLQHANCSINAKWTEAQSIGPDEVPSLSLGHCWQPIQDFFFKIWNYF